MTPAKLVLFDDKFGFGCAVCQSVGILQIGGRVKEAVTLTGMHLLVWSTAL